MATAPKVVKTPPIILVRVNQIVGQAPDIPLALLLAEGLGEPGITYLYAPTGDYVEIAVVMDSTTTRGKTS